MKYNRSVLYYICIYSVSKLIYLKTNELKVVAEVIVCPLQGLIVLSPIFWTVCTTSPMTILISNTIPVLLLRQPPCQPLTTAGEVNKLGRNCPFYYFYILGVLAFFFKTILIFLFLNSLFYGTFSTCLGLNRVSILHIFIMSSLTV